MVSKQEDSMFASDFLPLLLLRADKSQKEVKQHDIGWYQNKIGELEGELKAATKQVKELENVISISKQETQALKNELDTQRQLVVQLKQELDALKKE